MSVYQFELCPDFHFATLVYNISNLGVRGMDLFSTICIRSCKFGQEDANHNLEIWLTPTQG